MDVGPFMSSLVPLPTGIVLKGMSVRVGDAGEGAVCFDTASATLRAGWTGGFLNFDPARYGVIAPPKPAGKIQFLSRTNAWGEAKVEYRGFYLNGRRVVWRYVVNGTPVLDTVWMQGSRFTRAMKIGPAPGAFGLRLADGLITTNLNLKKDQTITIGTWEENERKALWP